MKNQSYNEIFAAFEKLSNNFKRKNQYFDILYDSFSFLQINKTPSAEDVSANLRIMISRQANLEEKKDLVKDILDIK